MPPPKELHPIECKDFIRNSNCTDSAELSHFGHDDPFIYFDSLSFQVQNEKKELPITVTQLNTVHLGVFL